MNSAILTSVAYLVWMNGLFWDSNLQQKSFSSMDECLAVIEQKSENKQGDYACLNHTEMMQFMSLMSKFENRYVPPR